MSWPPPYADLAIAAPFEFLGDGTKIARSRFDQRRRRFDRPAGYDKDRLAVRPLRHDPFDLVGGAPHHHRIDLRVVGIDVELLWRIGYEPVERAVGPRDLAVE